MFRKQYSQRIVAIGMVIAMLLSICSVLTLVSAAYSEVDYEEAGYNFLLEQYNINGIEYESLVKEDSIDLYDNSNNIIAKMMIVKRDDYIDYVVLDFMIDRIDEYGFDQAAFVENFMGKEKIYYAGTLNYAYFDNGVLKDIYGNRIDESSYFAVMDAFIVYARSMPNQVDGNDGIDSWTNVRTNNQNLPNSTGYGGSVITTGWFVPGITFSSQNSSLTFESQGDLNDNYNFVHNDDIDGTCAATAITNMFIYYEYLGFDNALVNNSPDDTFESVLDAIDWSDWTKLNWWSKTVSGMKAMATEAGYDYSITQYLTMNWNQVVNSIDAEKPIFTYVTVDETDGEEFAHAVVTVGYVEFTHNYTTTEEYWLFGWHERTVEHEDKYQYLRVIDGWSTSNDARYLNFNGFYESIMGIAFILEE